MAGRKIGLTPVKWVFRAWGRILSGRRPSLSLEITRECPLRCPGCYAYHEGHLTSGRQLRQLQDYSGEELIQKVFDLLERHRPLHVSFVGGEPLVRFRELDVLLPRLASRGIHTQVVTSAVRPIPAAWAAIPNLNLSVSVDGLPPEHDARRKPATYDRILRHIDGHQVSIHCTVTSQQARREGYLEEFVRFWSDQPAAKRIWFSLYTPQLGEVSEERLSPEDRTRVIAELLRLRSSYPKLDMGPLTIATMGQPPSSPQECTFARVTQCLSADLEQEVTPCQIGGSPDCSQCGCVAAMGLEAVARTRAPGGLRLGTLFSASLRVGSFVRRTRQAVQPARTAPGSARPLAR